MKFKLTFKTPDVLDRALDDADYDPKIMCSCGGNCSDCERLLDQAGLDRQEIRNFSKQFVRYDEYITIDFDTETGTATVRKN
jgi:hypothetical protein